MFALVVRVLAPALALWLVLLVGGEAAAQSCTVHSDCSHLSSPCVTGRCTNGTCTAVQQPDENLCFPNDRCFGQGSCFGGVCHGNIFTHACLDAGGICSTCNCDPATGEVRYLPSTNGAPCQWECEANGVCQDGLCVGGTPQNDGFFCRDQRNFCLQGTCLAGDCVASDPSNPRYCFEPGCPSIGTCSAGTCELSAIEDGAGCTFTGPCLDVADGVTCEDGDPCTSGESCQSGLCVGGSGTCECLADADCGALEDGNLCNGTLVCDAATNTCQLDPSTVVSCDASGDTACAQNTCNPATGSCSLQPVNEGGACDDGSLCTTGDTCTAGGCVGVAVDCSGAGDACNVASCDETTGLCTVLTPANEGVPCDDGDPCVVGETCTSGTCKGVTANCECQTDADCGTLEDGDLCNGTLVCDAATNTCQLDPSTVVTCDASGDTACMANTCSPLDGSCAMQPVNEAGACDDGDACTTGDTCVAGGCAPGAPRTCATFDDDCSVGTCDPATGTCSAVPRADATPCDDGDPCTEGDQCTAGTCTPGTGDACPSPGPGDGVADVDVSDGDVSDGDVSDDDVSDDDVSDDDVGGDDVSSDDVSGDDVSEGDVALDTSSGSDAGMVLQDSDDEGDDCGCQVRAGGSGVPPGAGVLLLLAVLLGVRRRSR